MKYAIIIPDGCADEPQESLGGKTPLQAAHIPNMDAVVQSGVIGAANHVPPHLPAGSAVANMSLLGFDPNEYFSGRAPLEAAAQGIELGPKDWGIRCNLVTVQDQVMRDFTADHITDQEAVALLETVQQELGSDILEFIPGVSYRNLLIYRGEQAQAPFSNDTRTTPPHDLTDNTVIHDFPRGPGSDLLSQLMSKSVELFADHPVNQARIANGKLPATNVWLWGLGITPQLPDFLDVYGKRGKMITAVDLLRGIAALIDWDRIEVEGATGYTDTNYAGKGQAAIDALDSTDIICVHVEATDEASHEGDAEAKIKALEEIDTHIVGPLVAELKSRGEYRVLVSPDHPTPIRTKTHSHGIVPFAITGTDVSPDDQTSYDEDQANASALQYPNGHEVMKYFLG
ncbi:MAG: cofactor-independent phosphoglycerate mutase [Rhodopirellula sp.]|nr:cofactor-independent phosphoglycerate mutase [Rhodopirellula sp.]|tara:strand:- start:28828 stop:30027 length:1200 start_codon:yes stop_codon:yes gene_type:complete